MICVTVLFRANGGCLKSLDEDTLFTLIRMAVKDGSPGDEKIRLSSRTLMMKPQTLQEVDVH